MTKRLAVFVSGEGSLLKSMIDADLPIHFVFADRMCEGIHIASALGFETECIQREYGVSFNRKKYTLEVSHLLSDYAIDIVAMAGFMTVLDEVIFEKFPEPILNCHPSLLPAFPGKDAVRQALEYGVKITGTTIHYAEKSLDAGAIIAQEAVRIERQDTVKSLHERIKKVERILYPKMVRNIIADLSRKRFSIVR